MTQAVQTSIKKIPSMRLIPAGAFLINNKDKILRKYSEIVHIKMGVANIYLLTSPELIQQVLVTKQRDFIKGNFLQRTKKVFGEGLLTSEGDFHHRQRRLVQPAFHHDKIASYAKTMKEYAGRTMSTWQDGQVLDIHDEMTKLTMSIVAKCLFGKDIAGEESVSITDDLTNTIEYFDRLSSPLSALLQRLPSNKKYDDAVKRIDSIVFSLIEERRRRRKSKNESEVEDKDLMSMLLQATDEEDGSSMTNEQLRDEVLILFAAGHETTANALTWTWYLLSQNPKTQEKLHNEVDTLRSSNLTIDGMKHLDYTTKVFTESMRLYPPAWILVRQALQDVRVGDYLISRDSQVVMSQYLMHHDSRFFKEPEKFEPERWTQEMKSKLPRFAYFPFGGGPRSCVGEPFAWMEGVLLLATIAKKWKMEHAKTHKVGLLPRITLRPKYGMKMKLKERER